ncbi:hypothetical protein [Pedobacter nyackensis]|uniref:Uncharacterized protein n=1 Tax=Pedobacter nyackensis TaxID=475255 RepID=A0A1W1ZY45_9SPHI|nr:hypothetical protein [Pedobacter nyackensis]SMC53324.1 hypothetical protein SAMN04488101_101148 [Pedobacter nyackensis]
MDKESKFYTDFLFPTNNFLMGASSAINLSGNFYEYNESENGDADSIAIRSDFSMIGQDIREAKENYDNRNLEPCL